MLSIQVHSYNKHYIHLRWILCLILSLFTTLPAISQSRVRHQTSLSDTLLKLKEVTIYSNRMQKKMSPVQILSGKELEKLNVYSVADALRYFSVNPEKPDVPLNKNDAFQKVQKRRVQKKR